MSKFDSEHEHGNKETANIQIIFLSHVACDWTVNFIQYLLKFSVV